MRFLMPILSLLTLLLAPGCTAIDEGCTADAECRYGRICVEGRCAGVLQISNNDNNANNSGNNENNSGNNENNSGNNENNANNENNELFCADADDCERGEVCSSLRAGSERWQCVEPWFCEPGAFESADDFCFTEQFCEVEDDFTFHQITCEFGDADIGECFCFSEPELQEMVFEVERGSCSREWLIDVGNTRCGWRLPDLEF